jgi:hypothetical protein
MAQGGTSISPCAMIYLGLSGAKQIGRELTVGEVSDVVPNAKQNIRSSLIAGAA